MIEITRLVSGLEVWNSTLKDLSFPFAAIKRSMGFPVPHFDANCLRGRVQLLLCLSTIAASASNVNK
jgi:hypothetical protein